MTTVRAPRGRSELVGKLSAVAVGDVRVLSVEAMDDYWPDDRPVQFVVHLSDPLGDTWDDDELSRLTTKVYELLAEYGALSTSRTTFTGGPAVEDVPVPDEDSIGYE